MTKRKKHTPEEIVRKLQTADRLTAEGAPGDEIARQLGISTATFYNWRNRYGAMDLNEAKELKRLRDENDKLKRLVADNELENLALKENRCCAQLRETGSRAQAPWQAEGAALMLQKRLGMSQRAACRATGQARSTQQRLPAADRPDDPDRWLRDWLNTEGNARKGYRRAWADLRSQDRCINVKRMHRIWRDEGLQVAQRRRRKRVGKSSGPIVDADAANVVWAIDFQFDSTADGIKFKIASMISSQR